MNRREAALILGIGQQSSKSKIKDAHKRIMLLNHPDRENVGRLHHLISLINALLPTGGSPYLAAKINEAKEYLELGKS